MYEELDTATVHAMKETMSTNFETPQDDKRLLDFCTQVNEELLRGMVMQEKLDMTKLVQFKNGSVKLSARHAWASRLVDCLEVHFQSVRLLRKFQDNEMDAAAEVKRRLTDVQKQSLRALDNTEESADDFWNPIIENANEVVSWVSNRAEQLQFEASHVPGLQERLNPPGSNKIQVVPLFSIKNQNLTLKKGERLTLVNNTRKDMWKVKNETTGQTYCAPSVMMLMLGPNTDCQKVLDDFQTKLSASVKKTMDVMATDMAHSLKQDFKKIKIYLNNKIRLPMTDRRELSDKLSFVRRIADEHMKHTSKYAAFNLHLSAVEKNVGIAGRAFKPDQIIADMKNMLDYIISMLQKYEEFLATAKKLMERPLPVDADESYQLVDYRRPSRPASGDYSYKNSRRVWEMTYIMKEIHRKEEVTYIPNSGEENVAMPEVDELRFDKPEGWSFESERESKVATSFQVLRSEGEQTTKFIIDGVVDPRSKEIISMDDAIKDGILVQEDGIYKDITTGVEVPIAEAMNDGRIIMTIKDVSSSEAPSSSFGMVSVQKTNQGIRKYDITHVVHPITGEIMGPDEAIEAGVVNETLSSYINPKTGNEMIVAEAIKKKLVYADLLEEPSEEEDLSMRHFVVTSVVDRRLKRRISFRAATMSGLIDKETGAYIDNVTGQRLYVADAIGRGLLKAREIDNTDELAVDYQDTTYVEEVRKKWKKILDPIKVIQMLKETGRIQEETDSDS